MSKDFKTFVMISLLFPRLLGLLQPTNVTPSGGSMGSPTRANHRYDRPFYVFFTRPGGSSGSRRPAPRLASPGSGAPPRRRPDSARRRSGRGGSGPSGAAWSSPAPRGGRSGG